MVAPTKTSAHGIRSWEHIAQESVSVDAVDITSRDAPRPGWVAVAGRGAPSRVRVPQVWVPHR